MASWVLNMPSCWLINIPIDFISEIVFMPSDLIVSGNSSNVRLPSSALKAW